MHLDRGRREFSLRVLDESGQVCMFCPWGYKREVDGSVGLKLPSVCWDVDAGGGGGCGVVGVGWWLVWGGPWGRRGVAVVEAAMRPCGHATPRRARTRESGHRPARPCVGSGLAVECARCRRVLTLAKRERDRLTVPKPVRAQPPTHGDRANGRLLEGFGAFWRGRCKLLFAQGRAPLKWYVWLVRSVCVACRALAGNEV